MLDQKLIDAEYSFLKDLIYVDICQIGIPPLRTQRAGQKFMEKYTRAILEDGDAGFGEIRKETRTRLARLIGGDAGEIVYTKNTTEGTAILAMGYPLGPGDNVVTCDLEHASNLYPWINASRKRGFSLRIAKTAGGEARAEDMIALMDDRTRVVTVSAVQAGTGYSADLHLLAQACRSRGAILAVDAIQSVGRLDIDVRRLGIDYLSCGGYKGLLSGFGVGFAWCAEELLERIDPVYAGAFSAVRFAVPPEITPDPGGMVLRRDSGRLESGTYNSFGIAMLSSSVGLLLELGMENVDERVRSLERRLRALLLPGLDVVTPADPARQGGMVVAYYPREQYEEMEAMLQKRRIRLTHRPGYLRMALGIHNTMEQMEIIAESLNQLLPHLPERTTASSVNG